MRCIGTKVIYITKEQREFSIETANQSGKLDAMHWYKSYLYNKGAKGILNRNSKSKWKALFLLIESIAKHCKGDYFFPME